MQPPLSDIPVDFTFQWYFEGSAINADQGGQSRIFNLLGLLMKMERGA